MLAEKGCSVLVAREVEQLSAKEQGYLVSAVVGRPQGVAVADDSWTMSCEAEQEADYQKEVHCHWICSTVTVRGFSS